MSSAPFGEKIIQILSLKKSSAEEVPVIKIKQCVLA